MIHDHDHHAIIWHVWESNLSSHGPLITSEQSSASMYTSFYFLIITYFNENKISDSLQVNDI